MSEEKKIEHTHSVLSLGAGVNSTALMLYLVDQGLPLNEVIFADTGAERPETYEYLKKYTIPYLNEKKIPFTTVRNKKTLIERCMQGHSLPDRRYRWSTRDFKIRPIYSYLKSKAPTRTYMGICYDEIHRVKSSQIEWNTNIYPLVEKRITRLGCVRIIQNHGWEIPVKSGCFFCPFTSKRGLYEIWLTHPDLWKQAIALEKNGSKYPNFIISDKPLENLEAEFSKILNDDLGQTKLTILDDECSGYCMT